MVVRSQSTETQLLSGLSIRDEMVKREWVAAEIHKRQM
jgi:hypothetical protein